MAEPLLLPNRLDLPNAKPLADTLRAAVAAGQAAITVDASAVTQLGGLCLQVLVAAATECSQSGRGFAVAPRSPAFDEAIGQFGVPLASLTSEQL